MTYLFVRRRTSSGRYPRTVHWRDAYVLCTHYPGPEESECVKQMNSLIHMAICVFVFYLLVTMNGVKR